MSTTIPDEETILSWFYTPNKAVRAEKPTKPYDGRVDTIQESITLTMQYLAAANRPFDEGRPRPIAKGLGQTLFWSIFETRSDIKVVRGGETKTVTTILYYGFDASGALTLETLTSKSFEDPYVDSYSWPSSKEIPMPHRIKLMRKLKEFRASLVIN